jgi:hypothetical protein
MKSRPQPMKTKASTLQLENEENIQEDTASGKASSQFIVEDTEIPGSGKITKSEFMASLRGEVSKVASEVLAKIGQTAENCPYISYWFSYYEGKNDKHIEQAIKKYAPETSGSKDWQECIDMVAVRVKAGFEQHISTGSIEAIPEELPENLHEKEGNKAEVNQMCGSAENAAAPVAAPAAPRLEHAFKTAVALAGAEAYADRVKHLVAEDRVIKKSNAAEIQVYHTMSDTAHFPKYYDDDGTYVVIQRIPAEMYGGSKDPNHKEQLIEICDSLAKKGIYNMDLHNNIMISGSTLYAIDFEFAVFGVDYATSMKRHKDNIKQQLCPDIDK